MHAYGTYGSANRVNFHDDMFLYGIGYISPAAVGGSSRLCKTYTGQTIIPAITVVAGWVTGYSFMLGSENHPHNWNEYEFDRDATYAAGNGGKEGLNGAVALWWSATSHITTGIQYRYADDKLGLLLTTVGNSVAGCQSSCTIFA
ncbi:MAG: outer membrane protein OmpK [Escherichia coli]